MELRPFPNDELDCPVGTKYAQTAKYPANSEEICEHATGDPDDSSSTLQNRANTTVCCGNQQRTRIRVGGGDRYFLRNSRAMGKYNLKVKRDEYVRVAGREAVGKSEEGEQCGERPSWLRARQELVCDRGQAVKAP
jgi:hypothetical protein